MTNKELWDIYVNYTREFTKYSRQLAFACAAICWFFKSPEVTFPLPVLWSLSFVILFFFFDVLQFFVSAHLIRWWTRREEKRIWAEKKTIDGKYDKPWWIDHPAFIFFNVKAVMLLIAFCSLGVEFIKRI